MNEGHDQAAAVVQPHRYQINSGDISDHSITVIRQLQQAGYQAYLVGGCVRDLLLKRAPKDFDVVTDALPETISRVIPNCRLIGRRFRLAHVFFGRDIIEVATFRGQTDRDNRHHQVSEDGMILRDNIYGTLDDDVWRRDLTINALYYDPIGNVLLDHTGGLNDLEQKTIRIIGDPITRFREDPVRILRALRFTAKLQFELEPNLIEPIAELKSLIDNISPARLFDEVVKLFHHGHAHRAFLQLQQYGCFELLFPQTSATLDQTASRQLIELMLHNTDQRIAQNKPVTPAFLFITFLWYPLQQRFTQLDPALDQDDRWQMAIEEVLHQQRQRTVIPKRFAHMITSVWWLQRQLIHRDVFHPRRMLAHQKFRAGFDFLELRSTIGEVAPELVQWWQTFQEVDYTTQKHMIHQLDHDD